jgi:hypothetical protein
MFDYDKEVLETKAVIEDLMLKSYERFILALMLIESGEGKLSIDDASDRFETWINNTGYPYLLNEILSGEVEVEEEE